MNVFVNKYTSCGREGENEMRLDEMEINRF